LRTIAQILKIKAINGISNAKDPFCKGFSELQKYHTTTHQRDFKYFNDVINDRKKIYKDHILPVDNQIEWIEKINKPIVVLLRNVEDTIDNYKRLMASFRSGKLNKTTAKELQVSLLCSINFEKFCEDLYSYNTLWKQARIEKALYVDYNELVLCPYRLTKNIVNHFGFKMPVIKNFQLLKAKGNHGYSTYTGVGYKRALDEYKKKNNS
jgi:hypothetical protein